MDDSLLPFEAMLGRLPLSEVHGGYMVSDNGGEDNAWSVRRSWMISEVVGRGEEAGGARLGETRATSTTFPLLPASSHGQCLHTLDHFLAAMI